MAKTVNLSARLQALADMVTEGNRVCDLGCDHGYLSVYLVWHKISPHALAMDVGKGPLMRAMEHVREAGLDEYITLRLSDGLAGYREGEADTLVCAGMGGPLMQRILADEPAKVRSFRELVLQPQSEIASFRRFLRKEKWTIIKENMVCEDGKFYPMMKVRPAMETPEKKEDCGILPELADRFGPVLLGERNPVLWEFLKREWKNCGELADTLEKASESGRAQERLKELTKEMAYLKEAAKLYGKDYD